ncbi:MAG: DUF6273 domain-containing protein [Eubacterium sp.]|nr:DUF6273 domain-containing protein [Eubacterium sp.]MDY5497152.1 DUF6273 domain-containing protein [Anaerobutyricum sp.]
MKKFLKHGKQMIAFLLAVILTANLLPTEDLSGLLPDTIPGNVKAATTLSNPRIVEDSSMEAGQKVTWDCIWFGIYPQTEIVDQASTCGTHGKDWGEESDYEVNANLYNILKGISGWDSNGDVIVDGKKYRRIKHSDVTFDSTHEDDDFLKYHYEWKDSITYHYFRYEPIKWRIINVSGNKSLLLSDKALDDQRYNTELTDVTWETSTIRSWMNGYGSSENAQGINYNNFINNAFTSEEQNAIFATNVVNEDNINYGTKGGNITNDKIFLLSESEVYNTQKAKSYGFVINRGICDEARRSRSSTFVKALGAGTINGTTAWWLRSPGMGADDITGVYADGDVRFEGWGADEAEISIRPALNLNLSASDLWSYAGTVCSDGSSNEQAAQGSEENPGNNSNQTNKNSNGLLGNNVEPEPSDVKVSKISIEGISHTVSEGKKIVLKATVLPENSSIKTLIWTSSNPKVATVTQTGVVTVKRKTGGKSVTITATTADGSGISASWKIKSMKGIVKKITVSGAKTVKAGKILKLKAKVTATKGANKKLKWTSSNTKYATVTSTGKVKTFKAGKGKKVKITAMSTDGSNKKKTVTIKIK